MHRIFSCVYCNIVAVLGSLGLIFDIAIFVCAYGKLGYYFLQTFLSMQKVDHFFWKWILQEVFEKILRFSNIMVLFVNKGNGKLKTG